MTTEEKPELGPVRVEIRIVPELKKEKARYISIRVTSRCDEVRERVATAIARPSSSFWLVCKGKVLEDKWCVGSLGVDQGSILHAVLKRSRRSRIAKKDFTSSTNATLITATLVRVFLDTQAPPSQASKPRRRLLTGDGRSVAAYEATTAAFRNQAGIDDHEGRALTDSELWAATMLEDHPLLRWTRGRSSISSKSSTASKHHHTTSSSSEKFRPNDHERRASAR